MSTSSQSRFFLPLFVTLLLIGVGIYLALFTSPPDRRLDASSTGNERIEQVVRNYLLTNPEILREMSDELNRREKLAKQKRMEQSIRRNRTALLSSKADFVINETGNIPVVEFFDYQCGYCKRVHAAVVKLREEQSDVRFVFKEFPILGPVSDIAARAAIASKQQGKYLPFHNALMEHQGRLDKATILAVASQVGLNVEQLQRDMQKPEVATEINGNLSLGRNMGITGTPSIIIGDAFVPGAIPYEQMTDLLDKARENCNIC